VCAGAFKRHLSEDGPRDYITTDMGAKRRLCGAQFYSGAVEKWRAREDETGHSYVIVFQSSSKNLYMMYNVVDFSTIEAGLPRMTATSLPEHTTLPALAGLQRRG
jgi:hypothetical protein